MISRFIAIGLVAAGLTAPAGSANAQAITQQMTLLLADGKEFSTFFAKQVSIWGQVVRDNNIKA